ncbi:MAG: RNA polymerase sigma factor [Leadbetterella sp.]
MGKSFAQFSLYSMYSKAMYSTALRILGTIEEAEDCLQEVFLDAFMKIDSYKGEASFGSWLKSITINKSLSKIRTKKVQFVEIAENVDFEDKDENEQFENTTECIEKIKGALKSMPEGYRVILSLHLFEGYDYEEIANMLKLKEASVRSQFLRGKLKLREEMKMMKISVNG